MKKFGEFSYSRPDIEAVSRVFRGFLQEFRAASGAEGQERVIGLVNKLRLEMASQIALVEIRHSCDTEDPFYAAENDFMDGMKPSWEGLEHEFYAALAASPFRRELEARFGAQLFRIADLKLGTFRPEILAELEAENRLSSEYQNLKASARIIFEGEERNLSQLLPFAESRDGEMRRRASLAISSWYREQEAEFDRIFDQLVRLRHGMARKLGYGSFTTLAYARLGRSDYGPAEVANYRRQVLESVVPLAAALRKRQAARLGLGKLGYVDEALQFTGGNARPAGDAAWILANGARMYAEMSRETDEFFRMMRERELLDLETRKGKASGGYCSYIPVEKAPFIFSNFNGTAEDVDVLTHEAGHAFQCWRSGGFDIPEYHWPTMEACEIHSMGMEFLAWPWMGNFFGPALEKYLFTHLSGGILFLPYGVTVDEFQHWVYEHPEASPAERKAAWRGIERKYLPWRDYEGDAFLESGCYWFRQGHIFEDPFYYIDYTLAQVCAWEIWGKAAADRPGTWRDYLALCDAGGSASFLELLGRGRLRNPFADGTIGAIVAPVSAWLAAVDDRAL